MEHASSAKFVVLRQDVVKFVNGILMVKSNQKEEKVKEEMESEEFDIDPELTPEEEQFFAETVSQFERVWKNAKDEAKEFSKKDLARHMFVSGALMLKRCIDKEMEESLQFIRNNSEQRKEVEKMIGDGSFWSKKTFAETVSPEEMEQKEKTMHMKHTEDMNYNCRQCSGKMSAHNRDWHAGLCDDCFHQSVDDGEDDDEENDQNLQQWIK